MYVRYQKNCPTSIVIIQVTIFGNRQVQTDRTITNNKPDVIIRDKDKGARILIDTASTGDKSDLERSREVPKI